MEYKIPPDLQPFIDSELKHHKHQSESDVITAALRLLQWEREDALKQIRQGLTDMAAGNSRPAEEVFADLTNDAE